MSGGLSEFSIFVFFFFCGVVYVSLFLIIGGCFVTAVLIVEGLTTGHYARG